MLSCAASKGPYLGQRSTAVRVAVSVRAIYSTVDSGSTGCAVVPGLIAVKHVARHGGASRHGIHGSGVVSASAYSVRGI
jgi:hypothetical protein